MLIDDFCQLLSVSQIVLYYNLSDKSTEYVSAKKLAYESINQTTVLDQVMWQNNDDAENIIFRSTLAELCNNTMNKST